MNVCEGTTKKGLGCKNRVSDGSCLCRHHKGQYYGSIGCQACDGCVSNCIYCNGTYEKIQDRMEKNLLSMFNY
jgi:hypothetical protein